MLSHCNLPRDFLQLTSLFSGSIIFCKWQLREMTQKKSINNLPTSLQGSCNQKLLLNSVLLFIYTVPVISQHVFTSIFCILAQYLYFQVLSQQMKAKYKDCLQHLRYGLHSANELDIHSASMEQLIVKLSQHSKLLYGNLMSGCNNILSSYCWTHLPTKKLVNVLYVFIFTCVNILTLHFWASCFQALCVLYN